MAQCERCGKTARFGHNVSFSQRKSQRRFFANLQHVKMLENGKLVRKTLCTRCIKTLVKV